MILTPRPMAEAPLGKDILVQTNYGSFAVLNLTETQSDAALKFYEIADLLSAAEIVRKITPEGYQMTGAVRIPYDNEPFLRNGEAEHQLVSKYTSSPKQPILRKLPPPVRYRFEAEEKPRVPVVGDWIWTGDVWELVTAPCALGIPQLCARRVEVKP